MLEPMRKRHTRAIDLRFRGPEEKKDEAIRALRDLGFVEESHSIPWREVLNHPEDEHPGAILAGARCKEGVTQRELAGMTGIPQRHISEIENGKRGLGKERAKIFGEALNIDYRVFM